LVQYVSSCTVLVHPENDILPIDKRRQKFPSELVAIYSIIRVTVRSYSVVKCFLEYCNILKVNAIIWLELIKTSVFYFTIVLSAQ